MSVIRGIFIDNTTLQKQFINRLRVALLLLAAGILFSTEALAGFFDQKLMINGAGATFPYPLYSKWFSEYQKISPGTAFNYQSIGSGGGQRQLLDETVDFGASDSPMSDELLKKSKRPIIHVPATMGAVVITYHLPPGVKEMKLTGSLIADIFLGKIKKWDDSRLIEINPELKTVLQSIPSTDILVVHRSDGSGTTAIFSNYLAKVSEDWKTKVGEGTALRWPAGIGGKGNEGVTSFVQQIPGSIGYVELVFAKTLKLPYASVEGAHKRAHPIEGEMIDSREFVEPSMETVTAAAEGALKLNTIPEDFRAVITLVDAPNAYPISSFTYLLFYEIPKNDPKSLQKQKEFLSFTRWALHEGQSFAPKLYYAPLPKPLIDRVMKRLFPGGPRQ